MLANYLIIAWRSIVNHKLFAGINILGLALSMSVCMMVMVRVIDNFSYDTFHPAADRTFRINSSITSKGNRVDLATTALPLKVQLDEQPHVVSQATTLYPALRGNANDGAKSLWLTATFTDPAFFNIFGFTLKYGNAASALLAPNSLVLTLPVAEKYFGKTNPLGRLITFETIGTFQVTGVLNEPPAKSHLRFEALASISSVPTFQKQGVLPNKLNDWDSFESGYTYARLSDGASAQELRALLDRQAATLNKDSHVTISFEPQAISTITPGLKQLYHETSGGSSWSKLSIEIGIALIILVAAAFNYTNLSLARALRRGKEVGIRKLAGAKRSQIFAQYIMEAVVLSVMALMIASAILSFVLEFKPFNDDYEMIPDVTIGLGVLALFLLLSVLAGTLAGSVPAWILSAFRPANVLRNIGAQRVIGQLSLRKGLMIFQFTLSLVVVIFLSAFYQQFSYIDAARSDYAQDNIWVLPVSGQANRLSSLLEQTPGVEAIAFTSDHFGKYTSGQTTLSLEHGGENTHQIDYYYGDAKLIDMMELKLVAGQNFTSSVADSTAVVINESACRMLGLQTDAAVGQRLYLADSTAVLVRGVLQDFHHRTAAHNIVPLMIVNRGKGFRQMLVRIHASPSSETMQAIQAAYQKIFPEHPYSGFWMSAHVSEQNDQSATISLLGFLAFMTVAIASLGLLGLVVYTVETRRKEISIRKIVGARISQIMLLLSKGYLKLLAIAGAIALPIGYVASQFFLMGFPNKIEFGIGSLLLCFAFVFITGMLVILKQTFGASKQNPSENLRSE